MQITRYLSYLMDVIQGMNQYENIEVCLFPINIVNEFIFFV